MRKNGIRRSSVKQRVTTTYRCRVVPQYLASNSMEDPLSARLYSHGFIIEAVRGRCVLAVDKGAGNSNPTNHTLG